MATSAIVGDSLSTKVVVSADSPSGSRETQNRCLVQSIKTYRVYCLIIKEENYTAHIFVLIREVRSNWKPNMCVMNMAESAQAQRAALFSHLLSEDIFSCPVVKNWLCFTLRDLAYVFIILEFSPYELRVLHGDRASSCGQPNSCRV